MGPASDQQAGLIRLSRKLGGFGHRDDHGIDWSIFQSIWAIFFRPVDSNIGVVMGWTGPYCNGSGLIYLGLWSGWG